MSQAITGWHPGLGMLTARRIDDESQTELAERLERATGKTWNQAKVSRLERGDTEMTAIEAREVARVQGRPYAWYLDGPNPGYLNLDGDTTIDLRDISKTDEEVAVGTFRPRHSLSLFGAKDLKPAPVISYESPQLDRWVDVSMERLAG